jgi:hypothetical protein
MKKQYVTAMGKAIDFEALKIANEETIAVGNMKVNARGDQLGPGGSVERSRSEAISDFYRVENREERIARQKKAGVKTSQTVAKRRTPTENIDQGEQQMSTQPEQENKEIPESANASEETAVNTETTKQLRGKLADSVAKEATVTQEKMPDPRKPKGVQRI